MNRRPNLPTILWALFILILCGFPGKDIPHISFLELVSFDKWVHAGIFFILVLFAIRGFRLQEKFSGLRRNAALIAVLLSVAYGGILEILQGTIFADRSADIFDFIANSFGCFVALLLYPKISRKLSKLNFPL
ncbi:MAG TPA: VanZ family protein [Bacteroidia bacterium]|nr:VanZ family protein [Bacteroidia bacterium]